MYIVMAGTWTGEGENVCERKGYGRIRFLVLEGADALGAAFYTTG